MSGGGILYVDFVGNKKRLQIKQKSSKKTVALILFLLPLPHPSSCFTDSRTHSNQL